MSYPIIESVWCSAIVSVNGCLFNDDDVEQQVLVAEFDIDYYNKPQLTAYTTVTLSIGSEHRRTKSVMNDGEPAWLESFA